MLPRLIVVALATGFFAQAAFAESSSQGLTGLAVMRTPETLQGNASEVYLSLGYDKIADNVGNRILPTLGYTQGWGEALELGLQLPYYSSDPASGLSNIPLLAKYRFYSGEPLKLAGALQIGLPTGSKDKGLGAGNLNFHAELEGLMRFGALDLTGMMSYGRGDYCPGCTYPGVQRAEDGPVTVPIFKVAAGAAYSGGNYAAFGEIHVLNARNAVQTGSFSGDPDIFLVLGGRMSATTELAFTGYAGVGLPPDERPNHQVLAGIIAHYTMGAAPAKPAAVEEPKAAPAAAVMVAVYAACDNAPEAQKLAAQLESSGFDARLAGRAAKTEVTAIYFRDQSLNAASEIARIIPGKQTMHKEQPNAAGAPVKVLTGCDQGPKKPAPPAAPPKPKKPIGQISVGVFNGCGKPGLAEDAAKTLLLGGYNVTAIADLPTPTTPGLTEVRFRREYQAEAADIAKKLPGRQRMYVDEALAADLDISVIAGCEQ